MTRPRGSTLLETLVAAAMGILVLSALTGALAAGGRALVRTGARAEAADTAGLAAEAFAFDVRRAGFDAAASGVEALADAHADRLALQADLDDDGTIDITSAERVGWLCNPGARRLSRLVGAQSMPLADGVVRCAFAYFDAMANPLAVPPGGLDAAARVQVALVSLDFELVPRGGGPAVARVLTMALRSRP